MDEVKPQSTSSNFCKKLFRANILDGFTENTSIHGIKYLGEKQRRTRDKVFWIMIFIVSFIFMGCFVLDVKRKFDQKSGILVEDERPTPIHSIPFPAVTICPAVKIKSKFFPSSEIIQWLYGSADVSMLPDLAHQICNQQYLNLFEDLNMLISSKYLNQSHIELLHKISPSISKTFAHARFASKSIFPYIEDKNGSMVDNVPFSYILTNEGICFTFNLPSEIIDRDPSLQTEYKYHNIPNKSMSWDNENGYNGYPRFPTSVWGSGPGSGLHLLMVADNEDLNTFCQPTEVGYKIRLHSPDEYPTTIRSFISIPYNTMTEIKIIPKIIKTSAELSTVDPLVRQCFFKNERNLKYFTYYNRVNCKLECLANYTLQLYGCVHFSLPRNSTQPICGPNIKIRQMYDTEEILNSYFQFKASIRHFHEVELEEHEEIDFLKFVNFHCNCLPACTSVEYDYSIEMNDINNEKLMAKYHPDVKDKIRPAVIMDIFFDMTKVTGMTRKQFYTFTDLIANIGGLLGLFMGASVLSIFEILYFLIVR